MSGVVDTSVTGFLPSYDRSEIVDFAQGLFPTKEALFIKRPSKTDVSFRYFWLGNY